jgi:hypothetical protein
MQKFVLLFVGTDYVVATYKMLVAVVGCYAYDTSGTVDQLTTVCKVGMILAVFNTYCLVLMLLFPIFSLEDVQPLYQRSVSALKFSNA